ncbi:MAG TPA: 3-oxoacyl-[acyl-carrier-protein] synthase III C-terminal domain-containing protein, partial [Blastocatellia bacterium]|nr:3-oxoacyl-[acyl-carrier-protein] synthase III C-terminal domain-containing protein [Blastocatellia bacterium]
VRDLLAGRDGRDIDALIFASTTAPYAEKQASTVVSAAADLRQDIRAADYTNSTRASTSALLAAHDSVQAGSVSRIIVVAADNRLAIPKSASERVFGDGGSALEFGRDGVIAELIGSHSIADEITDVWRRSQDHFTTGWEERFALTEGYLRVVPQTVKEMFERTGIGPGQISKAVFFAPDPGSLGAVAKSLGLNPAQVPDHLFNSVGNTGTAMPLMVLSSVLEQAKAGEKLLVVGYGNGCDALLFEATAEIETARPGNRGVKRYLASKAYIDSYENYARFRELIETERQRRQPEQASAAQTWRDRDDIHRLHGHRCLACGTVQYPRQRVCVHCQVKDSFEDVTLADKSAKIFTFTIDYLNIDPNPPTVMTVVDFEVGGRAYLQMTDRDPAQVKIGQTVEMTFRKMYEADGFKNYYWKCRPVR